jgi:hypothetical protein
LPPRWLRDGWRSGRRNREKVANSRREAVLIAVVSEPVPPIVGGAFGAVLCGTAAWYFFPRSKWVLLLAAGVGFAAGLIVTTYILISIGFYRPVIMPC